MRAGLARVDVQYAADLLRRIGFAGVDEVERSVRGEIHRMLDALQLPDEFVAVGFEQRDRLERGLVRVEIENELCEWPPIDSSEDPIGIANLVFSRVYANRDLLVSNEFSAAVWSRCVDSATLPVSPSDQQAIKSVVTEAVLRGCLPRPALNQYHVVATDGLEEEERMAAIEPAYGTEHATRITLLLSPDASVELEETRDRIFFRYGVELPELRIERAGQLREARGEFRLTLNVLEGPVIQAASQELVAAVEDALAFDLHLRLSVFAVDEMLARFITAFPMPVFNAFEVLGTPTVVQVLRTLLEEGVSIRDLRGIFGALLELRGAITLSDDEVKAFRPTHARLVPRKPGAADGPLTVTEFANYVRIRLRDQVCLACVRSEGGVLRVWPVSRRIEARLSTLMKSPLTTEERQRLVAAVARALGDAGDRGVLLAAFPHRRPLWMLLRRRFPRLRVLCPQELSRVVRASFETEVDCDVGLPPSPHEKVATDLMD